MGIMCVVSVSVKKQEKLYPECQKRSIESFKKKALEWNSLVQLVKLVHWWNLRRSHFLVS